MGRIIATAAALWGLLALAASGVGEEAYVGAARGLQARLSIAEAADGRVRIAIDVADRASGNTCRLRLERAWRAGAERAWKGELVPGVRASTCDVSLRPVGADVLVESVDRCAWACGAGVDYRGRYRPAE